VTASILPAAYSDRGTAASEAKARGLMRTEGKSYVVQDGDMLNIISMCRAGVPSCVLPARIRQGR
jgi:hypothetical protein